MSDQITSFRHVIDLWPTRKSMAADLSRLGSETSAPLVRSWHRHNRIPADRFGDVISAAQKCGFKEINFRLLASLWKARKASGPPAPASAG